MALETSVLCFELIRDLLSQHYSLTADSAEKLKLGSANCYRIRCESADYFLKEFQSRFTADSIQQEARLLDYLAAHGIPVAKILPTVSGHWFITHEGHCIILQEYINGITYDYTDFPAPLLPSLAAMLGCIHTALSDYELPIGMSTDWLSSYSASDLCTQYDDLLALISEDDPYGSRIRSDLQYKKELAYRCEEYIPYYKGVTYTPTHGDYQGCQVVCSDESIKAVIDFSTAQTIPAVWEIIRSYVQTTADYIKPAAVDIPGLCAYVTEYLKYAPLTRHDLISMPYVYLFQLARSKFGYSQYLKSSSEDRLPLLQFAIWRTDMCRYLEKHAEKIVHSLLTATRRRTL